MSNWSAKIEEKKSKAKGDISGQGVIKCRKTNSSIKRNQGERQPANKEIIIIYFQKYYLFTCWAVHAFMWRQSKWRIQDKSQYQAAFRWIQKLVSPQVTLSSTKHTPLAEHSHTRVRTYESIEKAKHTAHTQHPGDLKGARRPWVLQAGLGWPDAVDWTRTWLRSMLLGEQKQWRDGSRLLKHPPTTQAKK